MRKGRLRESSVTALHRRNRPGHQRNFGRWLRRCEWFGEVARRAWLSITLAGCGPSVPTSELPLGKCDTPAVTSRTECLADRARTICEQARADQRSNRAAGSDCAKQNCAPSPSSTDCAQAYRQAIAAWTTGGQLEQAQESRRQLVVYLDSAVTDRAGAERGLRLTQESVLLELAQVYEHMGQAEQARATYRSLAGPLAPPSCEGRNPVYVQKANIGNEVRQCFRKLCEETRERWMQVLMVDAGLLLDDFEKHPELGARFLEDCRAGGTSESDAIAPMLAVAGNLTRPPHAGTYALVPASFAWLAVLGQWIDSGVSQPAAAQLRADFAAAYDSLGDCKSAAQLYRTAGVSGLSSDCVQELATTLVSEGKFAEAAALCASNRKTYDEPQLIAQSLTLRAASGCTSLELGSEPTCMSPSFFMKDVTSKMLQRLSHNDAIKLVGYLQTELSRVSDRCLSEGPKHVNATCRSKLDSLDYAIAEVKFLSSGRRRRLK
jgi:hypothetical protein